MNRRKKWIVGGTLAAVVIVGTTGFAIANAGDDDQPLTGTALNQASAAALAYTGGGSVVESEMGTTAPRTASRCAGTTARSSRSRWT